MIPLAALSGSAIDMARIYVVKVRLQQACDAGVLAGRKFMVDDGDTTLDANADTQAKAFFANNFRTGWFSTKDVSFTPTKTSDSQVEGNAAATVPMTLMRMFGKDDVAVSVDCQARYDVADADIMFVLDTTGSMACSPTDPGCGAASKTYTRNDGTTGYYTVEESGSKIAGLRSAVMSFYDTVAANVDPGTQIRYGFVTYSSTVNVGYLLPQADLVSTTWKYQTRHMIGVSDSGSATRLNTYNSITSATCDTYKTPAPTVATANWSSDGTASYQTVSWSADRRNSTTGTCTVSRQTVKPQWRYEQYPLNISQYVTGATVTDPTKVGGSTSKWQGCIEERDTDVASSFDANDLPPDLDPDLKPADDSTRWRPMWPDATYNRGSATSATSVGDSSSYSMVSASQGYVSCGMPALRLATMTRDQVNDYVYNNDFRALGGTYHDVGMIWGTRLISPTGIFAADTAARAGHVEPNRYIVFMTDGDMAPNTSIYGLYGMERYDQRVTGGNTSKDTDYHNARFVAECQAAKNRNIKVFVVGFGQTLTSELTACASPGQAYYASDNASLTAAFKKIANQVAMLRLSQ
jgi:hypothetical protein